LTTANTAQSEGPSASRQAAGEICVLVGPSGCGKTTAMRMVNRVRVIAPSAS
jgi:ABC-type proline/glycine betaine transport system ATPase subunit